MLSPSRSADLASDAATGGPDVKTLHPSVPAKLNGAHVLAPDREQLGRFARHVWGYMLGHGATGKASLRCFPNNDRGSGPPARVRDIELSGLGDLETLIDAAYQMAREAAEHHWTFAPPLALFGDQLAKRRNGEPAAHVFAGEQNLACAAGIVLDLDGKAGNPREVLELCRSQLGQPVLVIESGGLWLDPRAGELVPKLHAHWRTLPAQTAAELRALKEARILAVRLAGDDASAVSPAHPFRAAGSVHNKAEPRLCRIVEENPSAPALDPAELVQRLGKVAASSPEAPKAGQPTSLAEKLQEVLTGKSFHEALNSLAMQLVHREKDADDVKAALRVLMEHAPRRPEWQARYDDIDRAVDTAVAKIGSVEFPPWLVEQPASVPPEVEAPQREPTKEPRMVWAHNIEPTVKRRWLVKRLIPRNGFGLIYGESQAGKTFVAVDLACRLARGMEWHGRKSEGGTVVYLAAEAPESVKNRIVGWRLFHNDDRPLYVLVITPPFDFYSSSNDADQVIRSVRTALENIEAPPVVAVFNDTLPRTFGGGSENKAEDMQKVVANHERIARELDCAVIGIHHTGKDSSRGPRGSYALYANCDFSIFVSQAEDGERLIEFDKERDGKLERLAFRLEGVELGEDENGEIETTCVAVEAVLADDGTEPDDTKALAGRGENQRQVLAIMDNLAAFAMEPGQEPSEFIEVPRVLVQEHFAGWLLEEKGTLRKHAPERFAGAVAGLLKGDPPALEVMEGGEVLRVRRSLATLAAKDAEARRAAARQEKRRKRPRGKG